MKEMRDLASQVLGVKEDEETPETNTATITNVMTPVSTNTANNSTQTEANNNIADAMTQTESEEASVRSLLDKTEERLVEQISQVRSDLLAQILPLLQNIQQEMKELRQDSRSPITPAESVPVPSSPLSQMLATPEKHRDQSSHSFIVQEKIPTAEIEEELTEEENEIGENQSVQEGKEISAEDEKEKEKEKQIIEEGNQAKENMETEDSGEEKINGEEKVHDSGAGSEKDLENNNLATPSPLKAKRGRKREAEKICGEEIKPRMKRKKVVKKISREEEEEEKPKEEKILHRQKATVSVKDDVGWEERGRGEVKVIKHLGSGQVRLELRGAQYGEICLSQLLNPGVLASFTRSGVTAWGWRDPRMKEQFQLTFDSQESCDLFKKALDETAGKNSLLGFIQNFWAWY